MVFLTSSIEGVFNHRCCCCVVPASYIDLAPAMQVHTVLIISIQLFSLAAGKLKYIYACVHWNTQFFSATLTSNFYVACPDDTVTFTCTLPGSSFIQWAIMQGNVISTITLDASSRDRNEGAFRGVLTDTSGGMLTATLTSLSEASTVEGTMVECVGVSSREGPLTITVAGEFFVCNITL